MFCDAARVLRAVFLPTRVVVLFAGSALGLASVVLLLRSCLSSASVVRACVEALVPDPSQGTGPGGGLLLEGEWVGGLPAAPQPLVPGPGSPSPDRTCLDVHASLSVAAGAVVGLVLALGTVARKVCGRTHPVCDGDQLQLRVACLATHLTHSHQ